jgi:predicted nucleic acid-binding protein
MRLVIDASVAIKWVIEEPHSDRARQVRATRFDLLAPQLLWIELASVLWKRARRGDVPGAAVQAMLVDLLATPIEVHDHEALVALASAFAAAVDHTPYDCLYLALAEQETCRLVTADWRFHQVVERSPCAGATLWIEDVP